MVDDFLLATERRRQEPLRRLTAVGRCAWRSIAAAYVDLADR